MFVTFSHETEHFILFGNKKGLWLLPLLWFGLEWFKGWFATGMPWLSLGYSQTLSPLSGFAPLVGVYGIGALCILMAVALLVGPTHFERGQTRPYVKAFDELPTSFQGR